MRYEAGTDVGPAYTHRAPAAHVEDPKADETELKRRRRRTTTRKPKEEEEEEEEESQAQVPGLL